MEILNPYLEKYPDSVIGINLRACNTFRLSDGRAAEAELRGLLEIMAASPHAFENDLVAHNKVVFRDGENALQIFPPLMAVVPEARLNLIVYHLRNDELPQAFALVKDLEPATPQEYILKGVVHAALGQQVENREHLKLAQQFFQLVGASASECDTIPGRQCMASCFFLMKQFDDVMVYLKSIRTYFAADPTFNGARSTIVAIGLDWFHSPRSAMSLVFFLSHSALFPP
jgi:intraflagellar transport protein 56